MPSALNDDARDTVSSSIRAIPDFPKKGILFQDVTTLLLDPKVSLWEDERDKERERKGGRGSRPLQKPAD
jgi:hypothetical protein